MKTRQLLLLIAMLIPAGVLLAQNDDVYYSPGDNDNYYYDYQKGEYRSYDEYWYDDDDWVSSGSDTLKKEGNTYITNNYYYNYDNAYYYSSRIRRFYRPYFGFGYYSGCYIDWYWYDWDPWFAGVSIYIGYTPGWYAWWYPVGWHHHHHYYWDPWHYYSGYYYGWAYNHGYYHGYVDGYWDGYWDGHHHGYYYDDGYGFYGPSYGSYYGPRRMANPEGSYGIGYASKQWKMQNENLVKFADYRPAPDITGKSTDVKTRNVQVQAITPEKGRAIQSDSREINQSLHTGQPSTTVNKSREVKTEKADEVKSGEFKLPERSVTTGRETNIKQVESGRIVEKTAPEVTPELQNGREVQFNKPENTSARPAIQNSKTRVQPNQKQEKTQEIERKRGGFFNRTTTPSSKTRDYSPSKPSRTLDINRGKSSPSGGFNRGTTVPETKPSIERREITPRSKSPLNTSSGLAKGFDVKPGNTNSKTNVN